MRFFLAFTALFFFEPSPGQSQVNLLFEDFNNCSLPAGWEVKSTGNQNPVWYVDDAVQNNDNNGQSMNGSCFLFIDDDATGDQTPAYVLDFISPAFDASQYPTLELRVDVHYRDWNQAEESFEVLVTDGSTETLIRRYDKNRSTGTNLYEFETLVFDLSLVTRSAEAHIIFRYNDAGGYNWWAGVDNFSITGKGQGVNVVAESFNGCARPADWETQVLTGNNDWTFGLLEQGAALGGGNSMDGSCFVFFDDDFIGQAAPYSIVRLLSPWFDGSLFSQFTLDFDLILRYHSEKIAAIVQHADGQEFIVAESQGNIGGPFFNQYQHLQLDLSPYRSAQMRVVFEYDDGHDWAWWVGLDNVKITGNGMANDLCLNARPLLTGQACVAESNQNALLDGPLLACVANSAGGLWYTWSADFSGTARLTTNARFNDVVEVFSGDCSNPTLLHCNNRDEHGFTGETSYFQVESGTDYLIRVSGEEGGFGRSRGNLCVQLDMVDQAPQPPGNDDCAHASILTPGNACEEGGNRFAGTSATLPGYNQFARHDVWYRFTAPDLPADAYLEFRSNANFSDIITLYNGPCDQLQELITNHKGQTLACHNLIAGEDYFIQVSGTFATIEGALCPALVEKPQASPVNDHCLDAVELIMGANCLAGANLHASFSGQTPSCVPVAGHDVWYRFTAPVSGSVRLNSGADFPHTLSVWKGNCNALENLHCQASPLRCDGFISLGGLAAGETYYLQIASTGQDNVSGVSTGSFCIQILDGAEPAPFEPMTLKVTEKCISDNITRLKIAVSGGLMPYQFNGNPDGEELASGEHYLVVVSDAQGCVRAAEGQTEDCQAQDCALSGLLTALQPTCYDQANGALSAMVTGGTSPYSYRWTNNAATADIGGLAAGIYSVTITDALECELILSATLNNPSLITAVPIGFTPPHQGMSDGAIYIEASGGTGILNFQWLHNGIPFAISEDLSGAPAGDYTLIITDGNGCTTSFDFTLTETVGGAAVQQAYFTEVFPNPAADKAWLAVSFPRMQTLHLSLWDASGKIIQTWTVKNVAEQNIPLDLKNLPNGSYQLSIQTDAGTFHETVVKKG